MVDAKGEKDREEQECDPDGQRKEDCIDEAGCWNGRGDGGVLALEYSVSSSQSEQRESNLQSPQRDCYKVAPSLKLKIWVWVKRGRFDV